MTTEVEQRDREKHAFLTGFRAAVDGTAYDPTPGEVELAYPDYNAGELQSFVSGVTDGIARDTFRLRLCHCTHPYQASCDCDWCRYVGDLIRTA